MDEVAYFPPLWPLLPELEDTGVVCLRLLCYEGSKIEASILSADSRDMAAVYFQ
jgi:hypothetical protein